MDRNMSTRAMSSGSTGHGSPTSSMVFDDAQVGRNAGGPSGNAGQGGGLGAAATGLRAAWKRDDSVAMCERCSKPFTFYRRRHHCRRCGGIFCADCANEKTTGITGWSGAERICQICKTMTPATSLSTQPRERHVVLLGSPGVGKSSLSQLFATTGYAASGTGSGSPSGSPTGVAGTAGSPSSPAPGTNSARRLFRHRSGVDITLILDDTIGQAQVGTFPPALAVVANIFLLVFSVDDRSSLYALRAIHQRMLDCGCYFAPVFVVGTMRGDAHSVPLDECTALASELGAKFVQVALTPADAGGLFDKVLDELVGRL